MSEQEELNESKEWLLQNLGQRESEEGLINSQVSLEDLIRWLTKVLDDLMLHQPEKLIQLMYRLDVDEEEFKTAFYNQDAALLAEFVVRRVLKKIQFRRKFKNKF